MNHGDDEATQPLHIEELVEAMEQGRHRQERDVPPLPAPDPRFPVDRADVIGEGAKSFAWWCLRFLIVVAALVVLGYGLSQVGQAMIPVLLALLITSVLYPVTAVLKRWGVPYSLGAFASLLLGFVVIGGLVSIIAPSIVSQWPSLADQTVKGIRQIQDWAAGPPLNLHDELLNRYLQQLTGWLQGHSEDLVSFVLSVGGSVSSGIVTVVMTLVIVFFMLKDGHRFVGWVRTIVGRRGGFHVSELFARIWNTLSGYIRAQAIVSLVDAVFISLGLWLLGVPLAFPIGILTFMAGFIPIVGAVSAGLVAVLVALVTGGLWQALFALGLVVLVQQVEGNVLQPVLQSRVMQLHPVIIILAVLLGGNWYGILGAFLAVPIVASAAVFFRYLSDMIDLRTGERTAAEIEWATDDGHVVGGRSEQSAAFFRDLVLRRGSSSADVAPASEVATTTDAPRPKRAAITRVLSKVSKRVRRKGTDEDPADEPQD